MKAADADLLFVPGWSGSEPEHWQSRWRQRLSTAKLVEQPDWTYADLAQARGRIVEAVRAAQRPVVLIAHSLGVPIVAHVAADLAAQGLAGKVAGAFLVAPPSEAQAGAQAGADPAIVPYPREPLPFPSLLVASRSDPHAGYDEAADLALAWGSSLLDAGEAGHLNVASGHGPWPEGLMRLAGFLGRLSPPAP